MSAATIRLLSVGLCLIATAAAGCGSGTKSWVVHPDGRIGPLTIDVSTESDVRAFAGKPFKVAKISGLKKGWVGHELEYRCGRHCVTSYAIADLTGKLADFVTQSPRFVSEHGSHVGLAARRAAAGERRKISGACGEGHAIYLRSDKHHTFALGVFANKVSLITYLGPHTLSYEELC